VGALLLSACDSSVDREPSRAVRLAPAVAARLIAGDPRFQRPFELEFACFAEGPTIDALASLGLVERRGGARPDLVPTPAAHAAGLEQTAFQSDIPIYRLPVGARALLAVLEIRTAPGGRDASATFEYRAAPSGLGQELIRAGARLEIGDESEIRRGRATLALQPEGWRVTSVDWFLGPSD